ncbi:diguanylate cyclase [Clostridium sp. AM58-1XD]|uniref:diguanylate cyclase domain-containing protein n=1 Tax=Clostridium sp. AM58-1XD TaxID=2292307 RepID=UPI000E4CD29C|nr:diguanylate cyclase [Clostridium sp. AM58-1XD]RGY95920.1 sensor domain-containing diguanylate cyclase [Clostridium sp. AM58-1XD]
MKDYKKKKQAIVAMIFLFLLLLSAAIIAMLAGTEKRRNIQQAEHVMISEIGKLQYAIDSRLLSTEILEMIVVNDNGAVTDFDAIAERLYVNDPAIRSLQLAPDGVVTYVYPLEGNEEAFGSLFDDPDRRVEAEYARDTGKMTLAGPYELSQGGMGLVARNPVYMENDQNKENFWGFSIAILNVPEIFNKAELDNLSQQGYDYQIYRTAPDSNDIQIIASNTERDMMGAIEDSISVPNGTWIFRILPKTGWISRRNLLAESLVALTINILLTLLISGILTIRQQNKNMVEVANTDFLTGLNNTRHFVHQMRQFQEENQPFGLIYLDLNRFKAVNDQYGHDVGDKLLIEVAFQIKDCLRKSDFAYRIGGDEFAVLIPNKKNREFYDALLKKIEEHVTRPYTYSDITLYPSVSCGYSRYPDDQTDAESLIREADRSMYDMKKHS